jgi:hypothetical protein
LAVLGASPATRVFPQDTSLPSSSVIPTSVVPIERPDRRGRTIALGVVWIWAVLVALSTCGGYVLWVGGARPSGLWFVVVSLIAIMSAIIPLKSEVIGGTLLLLLGSLPLLGICGLVLFSFVQGRAPSGQITAAGMFVVASCPFISMFLLPPILAGLLLLASWQNAKYREANTVPG